MSEIMTWEEICEKYPNQWLGLTDIDEDVNQNIRTARVVFDDKTYDELMYEQCINGSCWVRATNFDMYDMYNGVYDENGHNILSGGITFERV